MSLNYDKLKEKRPTGGDGGGFWASYADLATVLSVLFLLLYAVAVLRGTSAVIYQVTREQIATARIQELEKQITAFEILKEEYLQKGASEREREMYQEVLAQMKLLEGEAKQEKEAAKAKLNESEEKERGLNRYQEVVRNIINANMAAQKRLKKRDEIIEAKSQEVSELSQAVTEREKQIASNNQKIADIQKKLEKSINEIKYAMRSKARTKKAAEEQIAALKADSSYKISALQQQNIMAESMLGDAKKRIALANRELTEKQGKISRLETTTQQQSRQVAALEVEKTQTKAELNTTKQQLTKANEELKQNQARLKAMENERGRILGDLERKQQNFRRALAELDGAHKAALERERRALQEQLAQEKSTADARLAAEKAYRQRVEMEKGAYNAKLKELSGQLDSTKKAISDKENQYKNSLEGWAKEKGGLERELALIKAREDERRGIADRIRTNFAKAGINADVNPRTGEVTIHFGEEYFDYGSAKLKDGMQAILRRAVPAYAASLFQDPKIASRVSNVEMVGFASPTYGGKYVNPKELSPEARTAVNYNMDLSYQRAKSIFEYAFDTKRMTYPYQKNLFEKTKVSGLSYLRANAVDSVEANLSDDEYCEKYDCSKSQKVVIKFNFSDR